jgi:ABC-type cobalt transport system substrate-binding protein
MLRKLDVGVAEVLIVHSIHMLTVVLYTENRAVDEWTGADDKACFSSVSKVKTEEAISHLRHLPSIVSPKKGNSL